MPRLNLIFSRLTTSSLASSSSSSQAVLTFLLWPSFSVRLEIFFFPSPKINKHSGSFFCQNLKIHHQLRTGIVSCFHLVDQLILWSLAGLNGNSKCIKFKHHPDGKEEQTYSNVCLAAKICLLFQACKRLHTFANNVVVRLSHLPPSEKHTLQQQQIVPRPF